MLVESPTDAAAPLVPEVTHDDLQLRGHRVWYLLGWPLVRATECIDQLTGERDNPLRQLGAVANISFVIALVTGILLLFWYSPGVNVAYASLEGSGLSGALLSWVRSLHRYSSDACMFFVLLHGLKVVTEGKVAGARWLAWTTGILLLITLWVTGWLGYWLVWDQRARQVALGSGLIVDWLPIFVDPLSRSLVSDDQVNPLLFVVVFFFHMLIPLGMGVLLWLHLARTARSRWITGKTLSLWIVAALGLMSVLVPVASVAPAQMQSVPAPMTIDAWYLLPVTLTDRLGASTLWIGMLVGFVLLISVPWTLVRRRPPAAAVDPDHCSGCKSCFNDCPFDAISMGPALEGSRAPGLAIVDPALCLGCGICAGSCRSGGIGLPDFPVALQQQRVNGWIAEDREAGRESHLALVCGRSAEVPVDETSGSSPLLPDHRVLRVPCAGWVGPVMVDQAIRAGASSVKIAACSAGSCTYREGDLWVEQRLQGQRAPKLPRRQRDAGLVHILRVSPGDSDSLGRLVGRQSTEAAPSPATATWRRCLSAGILAVLLCGAIWLGSETPYTAPIEPTGELVISFKHPGQLETKTTVTKEQKDLPVHMRPPKGASGSRKRLPVRIRIYVDGKLELEKSYPPRGLWGDGNSVALERLPIPVGKHQLRVQIGDGPEPDKWAFEGATTLQFERGTQRVLLFDRVEGIRWR